MNTVTETVKIWGVSTEPPDHNLAKFLDELDNVYHGIPFEFRPSAEIDFDPYFDCAGDSYPQIKVTYERPENEEEQNARMTGDRSRWVEQLEQARQRVSYCTARLDNLLSGGYDAS